MYKTVYNPHNFPLTVDVDGRVIGGNDWGTVDTTDDIAKPLLSAGMLDVLDTKPTSNSDEYVLDAWQRTEEFDKRANALSELTDKQIDSLAADAGYDADATKTQKTAFLARRTSVEIPEKKSSPAASSGSDKGSKES